MVIIFASENYSPATSQQVQEKGSAAERGDDTDRYLGRCQGSARYYVGNNEKYSSGVKVLQGVLPVYMTEVIKTMRQGFGEIMGNMARHIRTVDNVDLPLDLLYQEESGEMDTKKKIVTYIVHLDRAQERAAAVDELAVLK